MEKTEFGHGAGDVMAHRVEDKTAEMAAAAAMTPWRIIRAKVHVSLAPQSLSEIKEAATRQAYSNLLLRHNSSLGGVVAAMKGPLELEGKAKIIEASPFVHVSGYATMLLFAPQPKCVLTGTVSYIGPDHVGLSVHKVFHAVLPIDDAAPFYHYEGVGERCWRYNEQIEDDGNVLCSKEDIIHDVNIQFVVTSVKATKSGLFQMLASIKHASNERENDSETGVEMRMGGRPNVRLGVVSKGSGMHNQDEYDDGQSFNSWKTRSNMHGFHDSDFDQEHNSSSQKKNRGSSKTMKITKKAAILKNTDIDMGANVDVDENDLASRNREETRKPVERVNDVDNDGDDESIPLNPLNTPKNIVKARRSLLRNPSGFGSALGSGFGSNAIPSPNENNNRSGKTDEDAPFSTVPGTQEVDASPAANNNEKAKGNEMGVRDGFDGDGGRNGEGESVGMDVGQDSMLSSGERRKKKNKKKKDRTRLPERESRKGKEKEKEKARSRAKGRERTPEGGVEDDLDNDEDENTSNIDGVLTQLEARERSRGRSRSRERGETGRSRKRGSQGQGQVIDDDDEVLVPDSQEDDEDLQREIAKHERMTMTQMSQSRGGTTSGGSSGRQMKQEAVEEPHHNEVITQQQQPLSQLASSKKGGRKVKLHKRNSLPATPMTTQPPVLPTSSAGPRLKKRKREPMTVSTMTPTPDGQPHPDPSQAPHQFLSASFDGSVLQQPAQHEAPQRMLKKRKKKRESGSTISAVELDRRRSSIH